MKNKVQLITYVNRLGCENIQDLNSLVKNEFKGLFGGVHLLPFYYPIDGEDAGFDPIDHGMVDPRLGNWDDLNDLSQEIEIMACLLYTSPSPRDLSTSRMPSSA